MNAFARVFFEVFLFLNLLLVPLSVAAPFERPLFLSLDASLSGSSYFAAVKPLSFQPLPPSPVRAVSFSAAPVFSVVYVLLSALLVSLLHFSSRRGQITVFILLGILVVGSFAWLLHIAKSISRAKLTAQANTAVDELLQVTSVKEYVGQCVDQVFREGIRTAGLQGGVFYESQIGRVASYNLSAESIPFYFRGQLVNVSYLMFDNYLPGGIAVLGGIVPLPWYPCKFTSGSEKVNPSNPCHYRFLSSTFNPWWNWLPLGYSWFPLHRKSTLESYGASSSMYPSAADPPFVSVEWMLERFMERRIRACANFSQFSELLDYDISDDFPNVTVIFGESDVSVHVKYPVIVRVSGGEPVVRFLNFYSNLPVRFKLLYEAAADTAYKESRGDPLFNMSSYFQEHYGSFALRMTSFVANDPEGFPTTDVLAVEDLDLNHSLEGVPFAFLFAKKNRPPSLDYVGQYDVPVGPIPKDGDHYFDFYVANGTNLTIEFRGVDPDDNDMKLLTYRISGWKEDYDDWFNSSAFIAENCSYYPERCTVSNYSVQPHAWTQNPLYYTTVNAPPGSVVRTVYQVTGDDIGAHVLRISVSDGQFEDWQDVRVLVVDAPSAFAVGRNPFDDVNDSFASIEDPYWLDASASTSMFCTDIKYSWLDPFELTWLGQGFLFNRSSNPVVQVPYGVFNISDVDGLFAPFNNATFDVHPVTLKLEHSCGVDSPGDTLDVTVLKCLPHRSAAASYPYHLINSSLYSALNSSEPVYYSNHTCCDSSPGNYGNITSGNECFRYENYTCRYDDPLDPSRNWFGAGDSVWPGTSPPSLRSILVVFNNSAHASSSGSRHRSQFDNDIYYRVFNVSCDGSRGNVCNGSASDVWYYNKSCGVCQYCSPGSPDCASWPSFSFYEDSLVCSGRVLRRNGICDGSGNQNFDVSWLTRTSGIRVSPRLDSFGVLLNQSCFSAVNCSFFDGFDIVLSDDCGGSGKVPSGRGSPFCSGTCGSSDDGCRSYYYTCGSGACNKGLDDVDLSPQMCSSCGLRWISNGSAFAGEYSSYGSPSCCGDDLGEFNISCSSSPGAVCSSAAEVCCPSGNDCVFAGVCYSERGLADTGDSSADNETCFASRWYDQDYNSTFCGFDWISVDTSTGVNDFSSSASPRCCGDDPGEGSFVACRNNSSDGASCSYSGFAVASCCPDSSFCSGMNGSFSSCYSSGEVHDDVASPDNNYLYCSNGNWSDPDDFRLFCRSHDWAGSFCCGDDSNESYKEALNYATSSFDGGKHCCRPSECQFFNSSNSYECVADGDNVTTLAGFTFFCDNGDFVEADDDSNYCENVLGFSWLASGMSSEHGGYNSGDVSSGKVECCGDDSSEFSVFRVCSSDAPCSSSSGDAACCGSSDSCVYNGRCYGNSSVLNFGSENATCVDGVWHDADEGSGAYCVDSAYDCYPSDTCYLPNGVTLSGSYVGFGEYPQSDAYDCCGDDSGEVFSGYNSVLLCCPSSSSCGQRISSKNYCYPSFSLGGVETQGVGNCSDSFDNDCDGLVDCDDVADCASEAGPVNTRCCSSGPDCNSYFAMNCSSSSHQCFCGSFSPGLLPDSSNIFAVLDVSSGSASIDVCAYSSWPNYDRFVNITRLDISRAYSLTVDAFPYNVSSPDACPDYTVAFFDDAGDPLDTLFARSCASVTYTLSRPSSFVYAGFYADSDIRLTLKITPK